MEENLSSPEFLLRMFSQYKERVPLNYHLLEIGDEDRRVIRLAPSSYYNTDGLESYPLGKPISRMFPPLTKVAE